MNSLFMRKVAVLLFSHYPGDARPRRAAESLAQAGMTVEVICLRHSPGEAAREVINGVCVRRIPIRHRRGGKLGYVWQYFAFITCTFVMMAHRATRGRIDLVHVHNMPDVLVFSAIVPKLRGARVILDLHDPMPELMHTIFGIKWRSATMRLIQSLERWSMRLSDTVITVNQACKDIFTARGCRSEKIHIVMNTPDEALFAAPSPTTIAADTRSTRHPFVIMYHGSLVERHGLDLAVRALGRLKDRLPNVELRIYGSTTPYLKQVFALIEELGLEDRTRYLGPKSLEEIVIAIRDCHVGVIPNRRSVFTEINTPTRIFEYLSQGKPVIAPRSRGILDYFKPDELFYFELGDDAELADRILQVYSNLAGALERMRRGRRVHERHSWANERALFLQVVKGLISPAPAPQTNAAPKVRPVKLSP